MKEMNRFKHCYICSDKGGYRQINEDSYVLNDKSISIGKARSEDSTDLSWGWNIFAVFDGMGGTVQGGTASKLATAEFSGVMDRISDITNKKEIDSLIREAFLRANNSIVKNAKYSGTTATVLVTDGERSKLYHLGDSRAFLIRQGSIHQITKDQTVEEMKKGMGLSDSIIEADKHRLTEYLGADESMQSIRPVESEWISYSGKDRMILCTDGLYEGCTLREILNVSDAIEPEGVASSLVNLALSRDVRDNVTCVYIC